MRQHQDGESFATSHRGPWNLIYYEAYLNQEDALGRERYPKSGSGRRFLRTQLRHYLLQEPLTSTASPGGVERKGAYAEESCRAAFPAGQLRHYLQRFPNHETA